MGRKAKKVEKKPEGFLTAEQISNIDKVDMTTIVEEHIDLIKECLGEDEVVEIVDDKQYDFNNKTKIRLLGILAGINSPTMTEFIMLEETLKALENKRFEV